MLPVRCKKPAFIRAAVWCGARRDWADSFIIHVREIQKSTICGRLYIKQALSSPFQPFPKHTIDGGAGYPETAKRITTIHPVSGGPSSNSSAAMDCESSASMTLGPKEFPAMATERRVSSAAQAQSKMLHGDVMKNHDYTVLQ